MTMCFNTSCHDPVATPDATINWVRIPTVAQLGGADSKTIVAVAQCRYHRGTSWSGPYSDYTMDLCSRTSANNGQTWGPLQPNITGAHFKLPGEQANGTDGRAADPNLLWDAQRKEMLLFYHAEFSSDALVGLHTLLTTSADAVTWSAPTLVNMYGAPGPGKGAAQLELGANKGRVLVASYEAGAAVWYGAQQAGESRGFLTPLSIFLPPYIRF
jgi:hypothetical protein